ncbi:hypothetical protein IEO21_04559 [Rhodonia placenta]|uniref:Uncharacterized protein n=1 Tax=Rhodonia placenta TaxID=104341 RepID=A0A8H7U2G7_9APHY|nr:hypothetical protein IEO21_04559 [Postia placenta]
MQPASTVNPANPRLSPIDQGAAQSKRSSLLNSPARLAYSSDEGSPSVARSHSHRLDPIAQQPPFMDSLPDQFGAVEPPPKDEKAAVRQLTVSASPLCCKDAVFDDNCPHFFRFETSER